MHAQIIAGISKTGWRRKRVAVIKSQKAASHRDCRLFNFKSR